MEDELKNQKQTLYVLYQENQTDAKYRHHQQTVITQGQDKVDADRDRLGKLKNEERAFNDKLKRAKQEQVLKMKEIKNNHTKVLAIDDNAKKL